MTVDMIMDSLEGQGEPMVSWYAHSDMSQAWQSLFDTHYMVSFTAHNSEEGQY